MKQKLSLLLAALLLLALLCGCGSSNYKASGDTTVSTNTSMAAPMLPEPEMAWDSAYEGTASGSTYELPASEDSAARLPENVKLIYRADIDCESTNFEAATGVIEQLVSECGGYFENREQNNYANYRYAYYTVRVPAAQFEHFCETVSQLSETGETLQLRTMNRSAEDVSEAYYDVESRLVTQQTKLARLQELLSRAENMEDIITIESAISETEWQIENLTGTLRKYDSLVGYSTITLSLSEVYKLTSVEEPVIGFGAKLASAFKLGCTRFVDNLQDLLLAFARGWVGWLIFLVIVAVLVVVTTLVKRHRRKKRAARAAREEARQNQINPPQE